MNAFNSLEGTEYGVRETERGIKLATREVGQKARENPGCVGCQPSVLMLVLALA